VLLELYFTSPSQLFRLFGFSVGSSRVKAGFCNGYCSFIYRKWQKIRCAAASRSGKPTSPRGFWCTTASNLQARENSLKSAGTARRCMEFSVLALLPGPVQKIKSFPGYLLRFRRTLVTAGQTHSMGLATSTHLENGPKGGVLWFRCPAARWFFFAGQYFSCAGHLYLQSSDSSLPSPSPRCVTRYSPVHHPLVHLTPLLPCCEVLSQEILTRRLSIPQLS
jgi:hypothetical protein